MSSDVEMIMISWWFQDDFDDLDIGETSVCGLRSCFWTSKLFAENVRGLVDFGVECLVTGDDSRSLRLHRDSIGTHYIHCFAAIRCTRVQKPWLFGMLCVCTGGNASVIMSQLVVFNCTLYSSHVMALLLWVLDSDSGWWILIILHYQCWTLLCSQTTWFS